MLKELIPKKSAMLCGDERAVNGLLMYNKVDDYNY